MVSTSQQNNQPKRRRSVSRLVSLIVLIVISALVWTNQQFIKDGARYLVFKPDSSIAEIASDDQLTSSGKFAFYAAQPSIDDKTTFNKECQSKENGTAILGCYANNHIYLYDVTDSQLSGIKQVTAAHEMLHAIYQRMSQSDKDSINKLVEVEFQKLKTNPDYSQRMAYYSRAEPGERDNELHSIIGTEVASISPQLEAHYDKYFGDRSKVVGFYDSYHSAFTSLTNQASALSKQLDSLNSQINTTMTNYSADVKQLNADVSAFNQQAADGTFSSQSEFNEKRKVLENRVNAIDIERDSVNALIAQFNNLRDQYNNIVTQSNNLYDSIDSNVAPAPKI